MNKYEEAIFCLRDPEGWVKYNKVDGAVTKDLAESMFDILQELVERDKPMKISTYDFECECGGYCRRYDYYGTTLEKFNFCPNCGQKLDWSDNNE